jgi:hypothetical protein
MVVLMVVFGAVVTVVDDDQGLWRQFRIVTPLERQRSRRCRDH